MHLHRNDSGRPANQAHHGSDDERCHLAVLLRRKLRQQVRPVASDNATYFVVDGSYDLEAFLDLPADQFKLLRAEGATVQEFDWHATPNPQIGVLVPNGRACLR